MRVVVRQGFYCNRDHVLDWFIAIFGHYRVCVLQSFIVIFGHNRCGGLIVHHDLHSKYKFCSVIVHHDLYSQYYNIVKNKCNNCLNNNLWS